MLLPLPETSLLGLDLLGEALPESLFLFLKLGVIGLLNASLAKPAGLHLLQAVVLIVRVLSGANEIQHVGSDEERAELAEVAVALVFD